MYVSSRQLTCEPNRAHSYADLGIIQAFAGNPEETIQLVEQAMRLNPRYPAYYLMSLGLAYRLLGRYEESVSALKRGLILNPHHGPTHSELAASYSELGQYEEAQIEVAEMLRISPGYSLEVLKQLLPYKDPAALARFLTSLRKAGLK